MNKKITIAIDGFSSTGKSTVAKELAKSLGYIYVDSGAMYRAVTLFAMKQNFVGADFFDLASLSEKLSSIDLSFELNKDTGNADMYLNGMNVENEIRTLEVSNLVSKVAAASVVRKKLVSIQKDIGKNKGVVMDGRDIGTVVFTDAELKIFMNASADTRAKRRYKELLDKGQDVSYDAIYENVVERDRLDSTRKDSPLVRAEDAIEIDNSNLTREEQFEIILKLVKERSS
ncbi:(d)CMP kinase [Flavobacteriaceae bacterium S356]|uniref:Cytidylate kinase n=1 Tax=Asprobacillus argus TaxID=3076534 RepID=A0ABU3LE93_9FLAO|nr:(d)CMP kinase [Flavobacteriaceae bacterium S356]